MNNLTFVKELEELINRHSMESESNTPDFILASFLKNCLVAFNDSVKQRDSWYGVNLKPGGETGQDFFLKSRQFDDEGTLMP